MSRREELARRTRRRRKRANVARFLLGWPFLPLTRRVVLVDAPDVGEVELAMLAVPEGEEVIAADVDDRRHVPACLAALDPAKPALSFPLSQPATPTVDLLVEETTSPWVALGRAMRPAGRAPRRSGYSSGQDMSRPGDHGLLR